MKAQIDNNYPPVDSTTCKSCGWIGRHSPDCEIRRAAEQGLNDHFGEELPPEFGWTAAAIAGEALERRFAHVRMPEGASCSQYWAQDFDDPELFWRDLDWPSHFHGSACGNVTARQFSDERPLHHQISVGFADIYGQDHSVEISPVMALQLATVLLRVAFGSDVQ
ncbi:MAG: hypothetical protein U0Q20_07865 [Mycobacterium sp.]|nr:hypothetical protein [Mycobacterium sp.]